MTREDTIFILAILKAAFPGSFKNLTLRDANTMIDLWQIMFEKDDRREVEMAVKALIATRQDGFSPTIGEVKEKIRKMRVREELTEQEAWALVSKACSNGLFGYKKEFEKLPESVRAAVGKPEQLRAWAAMDEATVQSVVSSNFMRSYKAVVARQTELSMLPPDVRSYISGLSERLAFDRPDRAALPAGEESPPPGDEDAPEESTDACAYEGAAQMPGVV